MNRDKEVLKLTIVSGIRPEVGVTGGVPAEIISESNSHRMILHFPVSAGSFLMNKNKSNMDSILETTISGVSEDNSEVLLTNPIVLGINLNTQNSNIITVESLVPDLRLGTVPDSNQVENRQWIVRLSNLKFKQGDTTSPIPVPEGFLDEKRKKEYSEYIDKYCSMFSVTRDSEGDLGEFQMHEGGKQNKIVFRWASRDWELTDDKFNKWSIDCDNISVPVISGSLVTSYKQDDTEDTITELAREIALLLSFALGRDTKPCVTELFENQQVLYYHGFYFPVNPFNNRGEVLIDNGDYDWKPGNIKQFIESAENEFSRKKEWWKRTLGLFVQGTVCFNAIEIRLATFNMLLDRMSSRVESESKQEKIIDENINKRIQCSAFRYLFHKFLVLFISKKWKKENSASLINKIKEFNDDYPFSQKVIMTCEALGIIPMKKSHIAFRHKLIHSGDFDKKLKSQENRVTYFLELQSMLVLIILKKFDFKGQVYLEFCEEVDPQPIPNALAQFNLKMEATNSLGDNHIN
jgi:hypothetical protein